MTGLMKRWAEGTPHGWDVFEGYDEDNCERIGEQMTEAAARELVAAPEVLAALEGAMRLLEGPLDEDDRDRPELETIRAAIAKAKGDSK